MDNKLVWKLLLKKVVIKYGIYAYIPVTLTRVEEIEENSEKYFIDSLNNVYYYFNDFNVIEDDNEYCIMDIDDYQEYKNPDKSLEDISSNIMKNYSDKIYLGYADLEIEDIKIIELSLDEIYDDELVDKQDYSEDNKYIHTENSNKIYAAFDVELINSIVNLKGDNISNALIKIRDNLIIEQEKRIKENQNKTTTKRLEQQKQVTTPIEKPKEINVNINKNNINVPELYNNVKKRVIGQDEAIKEVISSIVMDQYAEDPSERNRCLLIGGTGTGKTEIMKSISKFLNIPMMKFDSTQLTSPGYKGQDIEDFLLRLLNLNNGDKSKAEHSIVIFDEIDKKGSTNNDDVSGRAVLNCLLPFIDGTEYELKPNGTYGKSVYFNTSNLIIGMTGAFTNVVKNLSIDRANSIGFNSNEKIETPKNLKIKPEDLIKYGGMPDEFIGRISNIIHLNPHDLNSLKTILLQSDISPLKVETRKLQNLNVKLIYDNEFIEEVAKKALENKTGARTLKSIIESSIMEARWEIIDNQNCYKELFLTGESVHNPKIYKLK